jgi:hypothetical protein
MGDMNQLLGTTAFGTSIHFGGEAAISLGSSFALLIRLEQLSKKVVIEGTGESGTTMDVLTLSSLPVMAGLELVLAQSSEVFAGLGVLGGYGVNTSLSIVAQNMAQSTDIAGGAMGGIIRGDINYRVSPSVLLFTEIGYRLMRTSPLRSTNANSMLFQDRAAVPISLDVSGLVFDIGVGFLFYGLKSKLPSDFAC